MFARALSALVMAAVALIFGASAAWAAPTKLTHEDAANRFRAAGITWTSSVNCSDWNNPHCTSFTNINLDTVQGAITFKRISGCGVNISGGTEVGHADGTFGHRNGYKVDMSKMPCVTGYITRKFTSIGGGQWKSAAGNIYYDESNHWDV